MFLSLEKKSFNSNTSLKRHICCEDNDENNMPGTGRNVLVKLIPRYSEYSTRKKKSWRAREPLHNRPKMESLLRVRNIQRSRAANCALAVHRPSLPPLPKVKCARGMASSEFPNSVACRSLWESARLLLPRYVRYVYVHIVPRRKNKKSSEWLPPKPQKFENRTAFNDSYKRCCS